MLLLLLLRPPLLWSLLAQPTLMVVAALAGSCLGHGLGLLLMWVQGQEYAWELRG
jgi:hypothetical protein